jgi:hypothetical protein
VGEESRGGPGEFAVGAPVAGYRLAGGRSRRRWPWVLLITVVVLVILAVAADFAVKAFAQDKLASEIQQHGFPAKPSVTIEGFPFLTQVASHDIHQVRISAKNVPEGPLQISTVSAVMTGIHLNSGFTSGVVDSLSGSLLVTFPALAHTLISQVGPLGAIVGSSGLTLSAAGNNEVRASLNLLVVSGSATWRVTRLNGQELNVSLVSSTGLPASLLSSIKNVSIAIPRLPLGVTIGSVTVTPSGIAGSISGHHLPFGTSAPAP